jgi:CHAD domain-containing protein
MMRHKLLRRTARHKRILSLGDLEDIETRARSAPAELQRAWHGEGAESVWSCEGIMIAVDPSHRFLACRYLREQLDTLISELRGVRANEAIEPVHQARVASRRIRAALRMFTDCFEPKRLAKWQRQVRKLTRELGAARDRDVQIEFVESFLAGLDKNDRKHRLGIERLLLRLHQGRAALQPEVLALLDKLDQTNLLAEMYGQMEQTLFTLRSHDISLCSPYVCKMAVEHIRARREGMAACERALHDPQDAAGHHQLRIAAKKLRYTLEICDPAYDGQLADFIKAVKRVQTLLGDIHDCDVWVEDIDRFMEKEQLATIEYCGNSRPFGPLRPGLLFVREERRARRRLIFAELLEYRKDLDAKHLWETLESTLQSRTEAIDHPGHEPQDRQADVGQGQDEKDRTAR